MRERHFPAERNVLPAHVTMFHHLPGERDTELVSELVKACSDYPFMEVTVEGLRNLGRGVAFRLRCSDAVALRQRLAELWWPDLTLQDKQRWMPHITVQNKVSAAEAHRLLAELQAGFTSWKCQAIGVDLWTYLNGPWEHKQFVPFVHVEASSL